MIKLITRLNSYLDEINTRQGLPKDDLLMATSICSDELNHNGELTDVVPCVFQMGGLAGYPHCGVTGINAYLDHIPENGAGIIFYGPHIGKSGQGKHGFYKRRGQQHETTACGALWGLLNSCSRQGKEKDRPDYHNIQADLLKSRLDNTGLLHKTTGIEHFTNEFFEIIHNDLIEMLQNSNLHKHNFPLFLLGGITINTEEGNFFEQKKSLIIKRNGDKPELSMF